MNFEEFRSKILLLKSQNPLFSLQKFKQRVLPKLMPLVVGFELPVMDSVEDHLGLAAELGELITSGQLHALVCKEDDPESISACFDKNPDAGCKGPYVSGRFHFLSIVWADLLRSATDHQPHTNKEPLI